MQPPMMMLPQQQQQQQQKPPMMMPHMMMQQPQAPPQMMPPQQQQQKPQMMSPMMQQQPPQMMQQQQPPQAQNNNNNNVSITPGSVNVTLSPQASSGMSPELMKQYAKTMSAQTPVVVQSITKKPDYMKYVTITIIAMLSAIVCIYIYSKFAGGGGSDIGAIMYYAAIVPPASWLVCDGSVYPIADYAALYAVIGNIYGGVVDSTFAVPDLRGVFIRGFDPTGTVDVDRQKGGFGAIQPHMFASHTHGGVMRWPGNGPEQNQNGGPEDRSDADKQTNATGGNETRPINIALLPCIRFR